MSCKSVEDMHEQIINLFYAYVDNYQRLRLAEDKVPNLEAIISGLNDEIYELKNPETEPRFIGPTTVTYTMSVPPMIKPEYAAYIETYGHPPDGVFESAKLAEFM